MIGKIITLFLTILLGIIAVWPFSILKIFSQAIHFVLFRVFNYRKDVVQLNLLYALPDTPSEEIFKIEKKFYIHLSELIIEIIKSFYISLEELQNRMHIHSDSLELIEKMKSEDKHIIILGSHIGNWEWPIYLTKVLNFSHRFFALYAPLSFKPMEHFIKEKRERLGAKMINIQNYKEEIQPVFQQKSIIAIIADQSPTGRKNVYNTRFLSLDTSFFNGAERLAKEINALVVYVHFQKKSFGRYDIHLKVLSENSIAEEEGAITEKYVRALEKDIHQAPQYWLWSHKRWKNSISY